jgi:DNA-binding MarR family transcriptional regulator
VRIGRLLSRFGLRRQGRESVTLGPVEQLAIRYLMEFGPRNREGVLLEVRGHRSVSDEDVDGALTQLVDQGMAESRLQFEGDETQPVYSATARAQRIKKHIPQEPKTVMDFYL